MRPPLTRIALELLDISGVGLLVSKDVDRRQARPAIGCVGAFDQLQALAPPTALAAAAMLQAAPLQGFTPPPGCGPASARLT